MRDGDIYRWRWADEARDADRGPYRSYHCKSQIALRLAGRLYDTYWSSTGCDDVLCQDDVVLTFLGNCCDMQPINEGDLRYYRAEDVVDTRHPNNSNAPIYLKNGAKRDAEAMREFVRRRSEDAERAIEIAQETIERMEEAAKQIDAGNLDNIYLW